MNISEKLGIESLGIEFGENLCGGEWVDVESVRELEQQNADMLEALIKVQLHAESIYNTELSDTYYREIIEKADPQHRSWQEIKQLIGE